MPGLERETETLEASKRNSSQTNCTVDSGFPTTPLNNEGVVSNINSSTSVVTTQEANKGNIDRSYINTIKILSFNSYPLAHYLKTFYSVSKDDYVKSLETNY